MLAMCPNCENYMEHAKPCTNCGHENYTSTCTCAYCVKKREQKNLDDKVM